MMPITMTTGGVFYSFFNSLAVIIPYLIFTMLLITYCGLSLRDIRFSKLHIGLITIQLVGSVVVYLLIAPFNTIVAQGAMICVLAPTATSAPVITGMLKGNVASLAAYSLISNMSVAIVAPILFSIIGSYNDLPFFDSFIAISQKIMFLLFLPFILAMILQKIKPSIAKEITKRSKMSFYLWNCALAIVTGRTVNFIIDQGTGNYTTELLIAGCSLFLCLCQFFFGRKLGRIYNDTIAGGQGLGQKNTVLSIWMAQSYLNPLASIGPGTYVLWQNMINSYQVWRKRKSL